MSAHGTGDGVQPRLTTAVFAARRAERMPIVVATAYDVPSAAIVDAAEVDAILVGDSLGMTVLGHGSTLPVTVDDMVRHTAMVARGSSRAVLIADMPFMSWQADSAEGMRNAGRLIAEGGAQAVKVEGASFETRLLVSSLVGAGIPVMGHIGLTPQSVNVLGGYKVQGKTSVAAAKLMEDAMDLQEAGCFAIVLECVPSELAATITDMLEIPTIGIGAGPGCAGEVQVFTDLVGLGTSDWLPKHAKRYLDGATLMRDAIAEYAAEVRAGRFPAEENSTAMDPDALAEALLMFGAGVDPEAFEDES